MQISSASRARLANSPTRLANGLQFGARCASDGASCKPRDFKRVADGADGGSLHSKFGKCAMWHFLRRIVVA